MGSTYRYMDMDKQKTILEETVDETKYLNKNFGKYRRHQHGTLVNIDMIVKTEYMDVLQHNFWTSPQVLRASFDHREMLETDPNKSRGGCSINWTSFEDLSDVTLKRHGFDTGMDSQVKSQRSNVDQARMNRERRLQQNLKKFIAKS